MLKQILDVVLNETRIDRFFMCLLWAGPVTGLLIGFVTGLIRRNTSRCTITGFLFGFTGTLISVMWYIYNIIMDHFGLDSVAGLLLNLLLFVLVGMITGLAFRWCFHRRISEATESNSSSSADKRQ